MLPHAMKRRCLLALGLAACGESAVPRPPDGGACIGLACTPPPGCGNNLREAGEACDGSDLGGATCGDLGFTYGALACADDCQYDINSCTRSVPPLCGDGYVMGLEFCDRSLWPYGGPGCAGFGLGAGDALCSRNCTPDVSTCEQTDFCAARGYYNDGVCDACPLLGGTVDPDCAVRCVADGTCANYWDRLTGVHTCIFAGLPDPDCLCGDLVRQAGEPCDGDLFPSGLDTCETFGFMSGTLVCLDACVIDFSGCR